MPVALLLAALLHTSALVVVGRGVGVRAVVERREPVPVMITSLVAERAGGGAAGAPGCVPAPEPAQRAARDERVPPRAAPGRAAAANERPTKALGAALPHADSAAETMTAENRTQTGIGSPANPNPAIGAGPAGAGGEGGGGGARGEGAAGGAGGGGAGAAEGEDEAEVARRIRARIAAHRRYPALARQRGIEGTVRLSLQVRPDGSVDVAVVRGADPMLDEAAREAVLASAPLPPTRERLEIDLEYHLLSP